jgi:hypothetical protein
MSAKRRAPRNFNLTMIGHAAVWYLDQKEALGARPAEATAACACCDTVYPAKGLKPLDSDYVYMKASEVVSFERNSPVCRHCAEDFAADFPEPDDVYSIFDRGIDRND